VLKLRYVELLGFKSFFEMTPITFSGTGITCIVGPNGCGKSNVVDAVSWVLGEQSHKMLRAERMSDCIFNGTAKRPPMGLSEVTLTLVDPELANAVAQVMDAPEENPAAGETAGPLIVENEAQPETKVVTGCVELASQETAPEKHANVEAAEKGKPWK
jgi:energy-coupling factor transporter ATP-binding protein EcfA2